MLILKSSTLNTKLGVMIAIADENVLYLLEFIDHRNLARNVERLIKKMRATIIPGETQIIKNIRSEISQYFDGQDVEFKTPTQLIGSQFQKKVWEELKKIPSTSTKSYLEIAKRIEKPNACRAVAQANGANQLAIIIPCHRVINTNGELGGYSGGIERKRWLLEHEKFRFTVF